MKITEKRQALKKRVKSLEVTIIERVDPAKQFYYTTPDVEKELESLFSKEGGMKTQVTLHITFKKKKKLAMDQIAKLKKFLNIKMLILIVKFLLY